jgi:hypothetical protein
MRTRRKERYQFLLSQSFSCAISLILVSLFSGVGTVITMNGKSKLRLLQFNVGYVTLPGYITLLVDFKVLIVSY